MEQRLRRFQPSKETDLTQWIRLIVEAEIVIRVPKEDWTDDSTLIQVKHLGKVDLDRNDTSDDKEGDAFVSDTSNQCECF